MLHTWLCTFIPYDHPVWHPRTIHFKSRPSIFIFLGKWLPMSHSWHHHVTPSGTTYSVWTYSYFLALLISKLTYQTKSESRCDLNELTQFENVVVWNGRSYVRISMNIYQVQCTSYCKTLYECISVIFLKAKINPKWEKERWNRQIRIESEEIQ